MSNKEKLKRGSVTTKAYKKGSQSQVTATTKEDYGKINLRDASVKRWNETMSNSPAKKKRKASTPFSGIAGFGGFGSVPSLPSRGGRKK
jgi:hypothetical protein